MTTKTAPRSARDIKLPPSRPQFKSSRRASVRRVEHHDEERDEPEPLLPLDSLFSTEELSALNERCKVLHESPVTLVTTALRNWLAKPLVQTPDEALAAFTANLGREIGRITNGGGSRELIFTDGVGFYYSVVEALTFKYRGCWRDADEMQDESIISNVPAYVAKLPPERVSRAYHFEPISSECVARWFSEHELPCPAEVQQTVIRDRDWKAAEHTQWEIAHIKAGLKQGHAMEEEALPFGLSGTKIPVSTVAIHVGVILHDNAEFLTRMGASMAVEGEFLKEGIRRSHLAELLAICAQINSGMEEGERWERALPFNLRGLAQFRDMFPVDFLNFAVQASSWVMDEASQYALAELAPGDALELIEVFCVLEEIGRKHGIGAKPATEPGTMEYRAALCRLANYTPSKAA